MDNDKAEQALSAYLSHDADELQKILDTLERIEEAKTLDNLFMNAEEPSSTELFNWRVGMLNGDDFRETLSTYQLRAGRELQEVYEHLRKAKFFYEWTRKRYQDLKSREGEIKNPVLIKFIKDYEAYYRQKEEGGKR